MGQDPAAIRREIERTRDEMGRTVTALGHKANVPARARESLAGKVGQLKEKVTGTGSTVAGTGSTVTRSMPSADDVGRSAKEAVGVAQENPLGLAIASVAIGFLAGTLIPSTRIEEERIGPLASQVRDQAVQTGEQALDHGKQVLEETVQTAAEEAQSAISDVKDKAQQNAKQHAEELSQTAKSSVDQAKAAAQGSSDRD